MNLQNIEKYAVRLEGLPWKWIQARMVFSNVEQLLSYAVLSKDAPHTLAIAVDSPSHNNGWEFINLDLSIQTQDGYARWQHTDGSEHSAWIERIWIPLGFVLDVRAWFESAIDQPRTIFANHIRPIGHWVDFADLTRDMNTGGDGDRWFSAHFVGPSWWVVDWHENYESILQYKKNSDSWRWMSAQKERTNAIRTF